MDLSAIDKQAILAAIRERLAQELATMKRLASDAAEAASHEENKPENDKDMRSTEASYIARGQAARADELSREIGILAVAPARVFKPGDRISAGALVELEHRGKTQICFFLPAGGGQRVLASGVEVQVVTPTSPLGSVLLGLVEGDEAEVRTPGGAKLYEIISVR